MAASVTRRFAMISPKCQYSVFGRNRIFGNRNGNLTSMGLEIKD